MDITEIGDFLKIIGNLPTKWQITFTVVFFLLPKVIQMIGGGKVVQAGIAKVFAFNVEVVRRYQARKQREIEDDSYEVYTRTLMIESLGLFSERLRRMDHKLNHIMTSLEKNVNIEEVEQVSPKREHSETIVHSRVHERLRKLREELSRTEDMNEIHND